MEADITSQAVGLAVATDFSITTLFLRADIIVKSVITILIASSIYSWAIIIDKFMLFKKINKSLRNLKKNFGNLNQQRVSIIIYQPNIEDPMAVLFKELNANSNEIQI